MQKLTDTGENLVSNIASRYGLSHEAVIHMLIAVNNGGGSMAQFNCPELGGSGQWMRGGMTMVGDMFNYGLQATVDNLCNELSSILANNQVFPVIPAGTPGSNQWWPINLGTPFSSGAQNNIRYAVFPHRLAVELNGQISIYDTLDHNISGVSQQQGGDTSLTFSSQWGTISVSSLPLISGKMLEEAQNKNFAEPASGPFEPQNQPLEAQSQTTDTTQNNAAAPQQETATVQQIDSFISQPMLDEPDTSPENEQPQYSSSQTLEIIEKLAQLHDVGALTDEEYNAKKSDLLKRI